jgi:hypothetical protein
MGFADYYQAERTQWPPRFPIWTDRQSAIAGDNSGAYRGRKDHWRPQRLALVPSGNQALGILKHLRIGRAPVRRFLLRGLAALILHFAAIECEPPSGSSLRRFSQIRLCWIAPVFVRGQGDVYR